MIRSLLCFILLFTSTLLPSSKEEIVKRIKEILSKAHDGTTSAIFIYNPLTQDTIYKENITISMIPASVTKLFTTATALNVMGPEHVLSTKLFTDDPNLSDGKINGNLYIKGFGNASFTNYDLYTFTERLKELGIREITGDIIGDDKYFDDVYTRSDWIPDERSNVKLPPISALVVDRNQLTVRKKRGKRYRTYVESVKNPPLFIAQKLKEKIVENEIIVLGDTKIGIIPQNSVPIASSSILLEEFISIVNKHSDNFFAECLFKTIGAEASKTQGNSFYSQQAIQEFLKKNEIYTYGTEIVDGSGISRFDQITAAAVNDLLERMYFDINNFDAFYSSLSVAGVDGTLKKRMNYTAAENNFRGKTGSLNGISSVAGYLNTVQGDEIIVTILFDFTKGGWNYYRDLQDEIIITLTELESESSD